MKDSHSFDPGSNPGTSTPVLRTIVWNKVLGFFGMDTDLSYSLSKRCMGVLEERWSRTTKPIARTPNTPAILRISTE